MSSMKDQFLYMSIHRVTTSWQSDMTFQAEMGGRRKKPRRRRISRRRGYTLKNKWTTLSSSVVALKRAGNTISHQKVTRWPTICRKRFLFSWELSSLQKWYQLSQLLYISSSQQSNAVLVRSFNQLAYSLTEFTTEWAPSPLYWYGWESNSTRRDSQAFLLLNI